MVLLLLSISACKPPLYSDTAAPDTSGTPPGDSAVDTGDETGPIDDTGAPPEDGDGDGYAVDVDCDDANPDRYPSAPEALDGLDGDCDGVVDNGEVTAFVGATETQGDGTYFGATLASGETSVGGALVAVGAPGGTGKVLVYDGAALGEGAAEPRYTLEGTAAGGAFGLEVLFAPLDGDVYQELIVSAPSANGGAGSVYVLDGARISSGGTGSVDTVAHRVEGDPAAASFFGWSVAVAGDTTWIGAPYEGGGFLGGAIYGFDSLALARGTVSTVADGARIGTSGDQAYFGTGLLAVDWDGDGMRDLAVTSQGADDGSPSATGRAFVFDAETVGALTVADTSAAIAMFAGPEDDTYLSHPLAGDFDGDGHEELVLTSAIGPLLTERQVVVVDSGWTGMSSADVVRLTVGGLAVPGVEGDDGVVGAAAGDLDGDGKADLLVGDYGSSPGRVLVFGSGTTLAGSLSPADATADLTGPALDDWFGSSLLALDVAGDDGADLISGAPMYGNGAVFVVPAAF